MNECENKCGCLAQIIQGYLAQLRVASIYFRDTRFVKSVRIWGYSGPHFSHIFPHSD